MKTPYVKQTTYYFVVDGVGFNIIGVHGHWLEIEEDAKDGQEETHFCGTMELQDGKWVVMEGRENLEQYLCFGPESLEQYLDTHGAPE